MRYRLVPAILAVLLLLVTAADVHAAGRSVLPPSPSPHYVLDQTGTLSTATSDGLDARLEQFERETSNQIVVAMLPAIPPDEEIADYSVRLFQAWQIGQKNKNNGVLLLIFKNSHLLHITTGYGLEGALPDATCKSIIDNEITPQFKAGNFDGGVSLGVAAMIAATRGEYKGTGGTHFKNAAPLVIFGFIILVFVLIVAANVIFGSRGTAYHSGGSSSSWALIAMALANSASRRGGWGGGGGNWGGGSSWGGGGGFGGGGRGGFSGGGGSTGGGGASGSW